MKNKKMILFSVITLVFAVLLTGCGSHAASQDSSDTQGQGTNKASSSKQKTTSSVAASSNFPLTVKDEAGNMVTIPAKPQRIASVTEGTDEILSALVPVSRMVLVTKYAVDPNYSNAADKLKGIPQIKQANVERIIAAKPDLVLLASYTKQGVVSQIQQAGIPVYEVTDFTSISAIEKNIENIGDLVGSTTKAKQIMQSMQKQLQGIEDKVKGKKKLTVLDYSSYGYGAGTGTTVDEMIRDAGGVNAGKGLKGWQKLTDEEIVKLNPDVILVSTTDKGFKNKLLSKASLQTVNAVKNKDVVSINNADLTSLSQYIVRGVSDIAHALYPDVTLP